LGDARIESGLDACPVQLRQVVEVSEVGCVHDGLDFTGAENSSIPHPD
jgi:hypothetical protein